MLNFGLLGQPAIASNNWAFQWGIADLGGSLSGYNQDGGSITPPDFDGLFIHRLVGNTSNNLLVAGLGVAGDSYPGYVNMYVTVEGYDGTYRMHWNSSGRRYQVELAGLVQYIETQVGNTIGITVTNVPPSAMNAVDSNGDSAVDINNDIGVAV